MKIGLDENNYVIAFATVGDIENSIEVNLRFKSFSDLPCFLYKYENGELILDEEKKQQWEEEQNKAEFDHDNEYVTYKELAEAIRQGVNSYER